YAGKIHILHDRANQNIHVESIPGRTIESTVRVGNSATIPSDLNHGIESSDPNICRHRIVDAPRTHYFPILISEERQESADAESSPRLRGRGVARPRKHVCGYPADHIALLPSARRGVRDREGVVRGGDPGW